MDAGIVGRAGSGRTTVFRALLAHRAPRESSERHGAAAIGVIQVQDPRLVRLSERYQPKKTTPIEIHVHDLCPTLEKSFSSAELEAMKRMDVLLLVVPGFADPADGACERAFGELLSDLCFEDLAAVERRLERHPREKLPELEKQALEAARAWLESERPMLAAGLAPALHASLRGYALLTDRPLLALLNQGEDTASAPPPPTLVDRAGALRIPLIPLCASLEAEMAELTVAEQKSFLAEFGVSEPSGGAVTRAILSAADVIPFFTVGEDECRAWPIARGTPARKAAGRVHSDIERGFIRAEVIPSGDLVELPGLLTEARKLGKLRLEGKDYVVQDGDVVHFRFNV